MDKQKLKNFINILLIFVPSFLVVFLLIKNNAWEVIVYIKDAKWIFLLLAILCQVAMPLCDGLILTILTRRYKKDYTFKEGYINNMVGLLWCFITPSATGGQFAQGTVFKKQGIDAYKSGSCLVINFFAYTIVCVVYGLVTIVFNYDYMMTNLHSFNIFGHEFSFLSLAVAGFICYLVVGVGILLLSYSKLINKIIKWFYKVLAKLHIVKNYEQKIMTIDNDCNRFRKNIADLKNMPFRFILILLITAIKLSFQFIIPYFIALALGVNVTQDEILIMMSLSCYLMLMTTFVPLPGSSGGSELFFIMLFTPIFGTLSSLLNSAMLIWRTITFYIPLIYTAIVTGVYNKESTTQMLDYVPSKHRWFFYQEMKEQITEKEEEDEDEYFD